MKTQTTLSKTAFAWLLLTLAPLAALGAPANDNFANRIVLTGSASINTSGSNVGATKENGEPNHANNAGGASVWWSWTAPTTAYYTIKTVGSSFDTTLAVYTGSAVNSLATIAQDDDSGGNGTSQVNVSAAAGVTYQIAVDGFSGSTGSIVLSIDYPPPPPANDSFASAMPLASGATTMVGINVGATKESGEPDHAGYPGGRSVWYSWTAPSSGQVKVQTSNSTVYTLVGIYTGATVNALTTLGSSAFGNIASFQAAGGATYQIAIDDYYASGGTFTLKISDPIPAPANDNFASRTVLGAVPQFVTGSTDGATKETGEPNHNGTVGGHSVWYSWSAPTSATYNISVSPAAASSYALLDIYTGLSVDSLSPAGSGEGGQSFSYALSATAGTTYQIAVDGGYGTTGSFILSISQPPPNDLFASATNLGSAASGSNSSWIDPSVGYETGEPDAPAFPWLPKVRSIWWQWVPSSSGWVSFDTLGSGIDTLMEVFTGGSVGALTLIAKNADANAQGENSLAFNATSGTTYYIRVRDDESHKIGNVNLHFATLGTPVTAADHVRLGRAYLQLQTDAGMSSADSEFAAAIAVDASHPEAHFLKAITGFALLEQGVAFQNALSGLGILDSNIYQGAYSFPKDGTGKLVATPGTHTSAGIDYLAGTVLPALATIRTHLSMSSAPTFTTSFSDSESSASYMEIDAGDVGVIKAATYGLEAVIRLLQTFDAGVSMTDVITDYNAGQLNAEKAIDAFVGLLNSTGSNQRTGFKNAIQGAVAEYTTASDFLRNSRTGDPMTHLCRLNSKHFAAEQKVLATAQSTSQALDGPAMIGSETTDLSKFVTSSKSLREQLPVLVGNKGVAGTAPDPTFDGVVPNSSQTRVNDFLRKKGLLYEVGNFGSWASAFLRNLSPADQTKSANPDKDMLSNFAEYAFNVNPNVPTSQGAYQTNQLATNVSDGKKYLQIAFLRRIVRHDISYIVAVSDDLTTWDRTQAQIQQVGAPQPSADGQTEAVTYRLMALPEITSRKFMRIEITDLSP